MRAVNLLPRDDAAQNRRLPPPPVLFGCIGTVLVTILLAVLFLSASAKVARQREALAEAKAQYLAIPAPAPPSPVIAQLPQERQTRVAALATVLGQRVPWDRVLREVSQVVPSDVWLLSLTAQAPSLTAAAPALGTALPQGFTVTGCTYSQDAVARFLARLDVVPDLANMTLAKSTAGTGGSGGAADSSGTSSASGGGNGCPGSMVAFTLQGQIHVAGPAS
jgi:Tfp pilus assembly protein PilN